MGVNAIILLPPDVRIKDAADVIGVLAGLPAEKQPLGEASYSCRVKGVKTKPSSIPEMATIELEGDLIDGEQNHYTTWHWEPDSVNANGNRMLYPKSTPFWIAIGIKLVDFFGGSIAFNDCDGDKPDYEQPKRLKANNPTDGEDWKAFQDKKLNLKPLKKQDLKNTNALAAYKTT